RGDRARGLVVRPLRVGPRAARADDAGGRGAAPDPARAPALRRQRQRGRARARAVAERALPAAAAVWAQGLKRAPHDAVVMLLSLAAGLPGVVATFLLLFYAGAEAKVIWTVGAVVLCTWLLVSMSLRERVLRPLQTA